MPTFSLTFLLGDLLLQQFKHLPNLYWVILFFILTFLRRKHSKLIFILACGFVYSYFYAQHELQAGIPKTVEGKSVTIIGYIASLPNVEPDQTEFLFSLKQLNNHRARGLIHLSWRNCIEKLKVGDKWRLEVKLKRIHGLMNPGGFDYEAWALQEGIRANGYIITKCHNLILNHNFWKYPINRFREYLKEKIEKNLPETNTSPWIYALALGERHGIAEENWEVLRNTGTNHLMAIAGLHIGFMSGFIFSIVSWFWRRIPSLTLKLPAFHAGAIGALFVAIIYSALAGFSIPTQRACIMLSSFLVVLLLRRKTMVWQAWSIALFTVLLLNPFSVLTESFCLSFGSVAIIIYGVSGRLNPHGLWWKWGRIQWVVTIGLIPLSIGLFQQYSLVSFAANSIAIPWVGFVIVPLTLAGCFTLLFSEKLGSLLFILADKNLSWLWSILSYLSHLPWAVWYQSIPHIGMLIAACIGVILLLLPKGMSGRGFGIIWLLPIILYKPNAPQAGEAWFTLLDVGQGLSAVVQTQYHTLVFDTGARFNDHYDMGSSVVIPYLRTLAIKKLDMLVISHQDNDHSGGSQAIIKQIPIKLIKTSVPEKFSYEQASYCIRGQSWRWDGVDFQFLHPSKELLNLDNNSSCVLKVKAFGKSILLTGDIEKVAEKNLLENEIKNLKSDILIAPHHGSKTSAEEAFIRAVQPEIVLFPVGYRNRYRFPNKDVIEKYQKLHVIQYDTVNAGAISFILSNSKDISQPTLYRQKYLRYYHL